MRLRFAMRNLIKIFGTCDSLFVYLCLKAMGKPRYAALYVRSRVTCTASVSLPSRFHFEILIYVIPVTRLKSEVELMIHDVGINNIERVSTLVSLETA